MRRIAILGLFGALLLGLATSEAHARGGRYGAPSSAEPREAPAPDGGDAEEPPPLCPEGGTPPGVPGVEPPTPTVPSEATGRVRPGRIGAKTPGPTQWTWWYQTQRERYEDLRARHLLTTSTPIFGVGDVFGANPDSATEHLTPAQRREILRALQDVLSPGGNHWIHTEAAALVGLGKVAERPVDLQAHFALLAPDSPAEEYLKESAILGLANLRREAVEDRLAASLLDRVREALERVLASPAFRPKTRGHAALALAMLADQPSLENGDCARNTAQTLFDAWIETDLPEEIQVGILLGMARLPPASTTNAMRLVLGGCAERGSEWPKARSALVRANALIALARLGDARDARLIAGILARAKGQPTLVEQAAPLAAAILGERVPVARAALGGAVQDALGVQREPGARRLLIAALGRLLADEARVGDEYLLLDRKVGATLLALLKDGSQEERPFAGVALGQVLRGIGRDVRTAAWNAFQREAVNALREAFATESGDVATRAAYAVALGIAGDGNSARRLLALLENEDEAPEARAYAALALGLLGDGRQEVAEAVTAAVSDPRSQVLQAQAATALGLLGDGDRDKRARLLATLVREMRAAPLPYVKGQIAITLGRIGDGRAIPALVEILEDPKEPHLNRAVACAALGLLGERAVHPALAPVRWDAHYLSHSALVHDVLDVL